jgi:hypothetical protein
MYNKIHCFAAKYGNVSYLMSTADQTETLEFFFSPRKIAVLYSSEIDAASLFLTC